MVLITRQSQIQQLYGRSADLLLIPEQRTRTHDHVHGNIELSSLRKWEALSRVNAPLPVSSEMLILS